MSISLVCLENRTLADRLGPAAGALQTRGQQFKSACSHQRKYQASAPNRFRARLAHTSISICDASFVSHNALRGSALDQIHDEYSDQRLDSATVDLDVMRVTGELGVTGTPVGLAATASRARGGWRDMAFIRRNVWELGGDWADEVLWYARGVAAMKARPLATPTSWRFYAGMHGFNASRWQELGYLSPM